ncbi:MAG: DJ-1/PfpI family protein [Lachnospiraceae bacterium]|nr:DJ-1/PfpI family protein [Lachnospiraceae bacterium]
MDLYFLFFDDFQTLDIFGPADVLSRLPGAVPHYISLTGGPVRSAQGGIVRTDAAPRDLHGILVIPGGRGTRALVSDEAFLAALKDLCQNAEYVLSVCTGSALLAKAGLLNGRRATSNRKAFEWVRSCSDRVAWTKEARWVTDGKYYTSAGVSAGIDMALGFAQDLFGEAEAERIAADMEYVRNGRIG